MNAQQLFRRSRIRLALWYALVMGVILGLSGFGMYRALLQSNWAALEREIESSAGTLHDSLEPMLPDSENPTGVLKQIFPELCLVGQPCNVSPTLIQRHTTGISDRSIYYIRLYNHHGKLLAFSPNLPPQLPQVFNGEPWQTFDSANGIRHHQFTTILHSANANHTADKRTSHPSWGYLQIGRALEDFDAERNRMRWTFAVALPIALALVAASSWWLSGLAMKPIYQSYQQQQQFTANAAHELRSPLASLLATVEAILRLPGSNPHEVQTMLQTVERQGRRLSHLIADLLFLTNLEQNASLKPFQPCCLNDLISDLTEEFMELAIAADVHLTHQIPDSEVYALGDGSQLYRLVSNLIANAIQYTPGDGFVTVALATTDRNALISVKDTGIGIPPDEQSHIFDRFYRVDGDRSRKTGGTGLGLAIVQAIVNRHHAMLRVESQIGQGSIFTVEFPLHS